MRVGNNPNKQKEARPLKNLVLAVVVHLPNLEGYHQRRFEIVQDCLRTMVNGAHYDHSLIVWDNASIPDLKQWIKREIQPDIYIESQDVSLTFAKAAIAKMIPPESILCYSDDDMYFEDDWLTPQLELLHYFPNVACVTGYPVRTSFRWGNENTKAWAAANAKLEKGRFIPQQWDDDFALSVGRTVEYQREYTKDDIDWRITYQGMQAYATSHHCQFTGYAGKIAQAITHGSGKALESETGFDVALDKIGLRLATTQRLVRHIGNVPDFETVSTDSYKIAMEA